MRLADRSLDALLSGEAATIPPFREICRPGPSIHTDALTASRLEVRRSAKMLNRGMSELRADGDLLELILRWLSLLKELLKAAAWVEAYATFVGRRLPGLDASLAPTMASPALRIAPSLSEIAMSR